MFASTVDDYAVEEKVCNFKQSLLDECRIARGDWGWTCDDELEFKRGTACAANEYFHPVHAKCVARCDESTGADAPASADCDPCMPCVNHWAHLGCPLSDGHVDLQDRVECKACTQCLEAAFANGVCSKTANATNA